MVNLPLIEGEGRSGAASQARVYTSDFLDKVTKPIGMSLTSGTFPRACPLAQVGHPELAHFHLYLTPQVGAGDFLSSADTGGWAY